MHSDMSISVLGINKLYDSYRTPLGRLKRIFSNSPNQGFQALTDINFNISKGETVGIVGRNGSGKSTLLQIICGTLRPTSGQVEHQGRIAALLELGSSINPEFTGRENIYLNAAILGLSNAETDACYEGITDFAELGEHINHPVKTYSSGMVMRLAFSVAINIRPDIFVIDEALAVGDELFQRKCFARLEALKQNGTTILFVSHSAAAVIELCDRAILLDKGKIINQGKPGVIITAYQELLYGKASASSSKQASKTLLQASDYEKGLIAKNTLSYQCNGARISQPHLKNAQGQRVNRLYKGQQYQFCYQVDFDRSAADIRFAMLIKTTTGTELGGGLIRPHYKVKTPGTQQIKLNFSCRLNPGIYYLNAGVVANIEGNDEYLHRLLDATVFRVSAETPSSATCLIDFDIEMDSTVDYA